MGPTGDAGILYPPGGCRTKILNGHFRDLNFSSGEG